MSDAPTLPGDDPFADIDPQAGNAPVGEDPFADIGIPRVKPAQVSGLSSFMSGAARSILPTGGGMVGAGAGAELGAGIGAFGGPVGAAVGGLVGGIGGFLAGSSAVSATQDYALRQMPDSWQEAIGQSSRQQRLQEEQHPVYSFMGGLAPYLVTMGPGAFTTKALNLPENATTFQKIMANPVTSRLFGGAAMGGMELAQEEITEGHPDWTKVAISTGFGMVLNKPLPLGEYLTNAGANLARGISLPARNAAVGFNMLRSPMNVPPEGILLPTEPTVAQAADLGVIGPGITEKTFQGSEQQSPETRATAHNGAADEQAALGPLPQHDIEGTARRLAPDVFARRDELLEQRDALPGAYAGVRGAADLVRHGARHMGSCPHAHPLIRQH